MAAPSWIAERLREHAYERAGLPYPGPGVASPTPAEHLAAAERDLAEAETELQRIRAVEAVAARRVNARAVVVATLRIATERARAGTFDAAA